MPDYSEAERAAIVAALVGRTIGEVDVDEYGDTYIHFTDGTDVNMARGAGVVSVRLIAPQSEGSQQQ